MTNANGETALDLSRRFAQLGCIELLATAMGVDDEEEDENDDDRQSRAWRRSHGHASTTIASGAVRPSVRPSSANARREAKARALDKLKETARMMEISKKNFEQLGGDLGQLDILVAESKKVDSPDEVQVKKVS